MNIAYAVAGVVKDYAPGACRIVLVAVAVHGLEAEAACGQAEQKVSKTIGIGVAGDTVVVCGQIQLGEVELVMALAIEKRCGSHGADTEQAATVADAPTIAIE